MASAGNLNGKSFREDPITGYMQATNSHALSGFTPDTKQFFLDFLRTKFNIGRACQAAGITRQTYLNAMEVDPKFNQELNNIKEGHLDDFESCLFDDAKTDGPKSYIPKIFLLKSLRRHIYGDRTTVEYKTDKRGTESLFNHIIARKIQDGTMIDVDQGDAHPTNGDASKSPDGK